MKWLLSFLLCMFISCMNYGGNPCDKEYKLKDDDLDLVTFSLNSLHNDWKNLGIKSHTVFSGDSLVFLWPHAKLYEPGGYPWFPDGEYVNTGIPGSTACELYYRRKNAISHYEPKNIFINIGGNDLYYGVDENRIIHFIGMTFELLREENANARIIYGAVPPTQNRLINSIKGDFNRKVKERIFEVENICYVDINEFLAIDSVEGNPSKHNLKGDGVHFDTTVYNYYKKLLEKGFDEKYFNNDSNIQCNL